MFRTKTQKGRRAARPAFVTPMFCKEVTRLPAVDGWFYEVKRNGQRAIGIKEGKDVKLLCHKGKPLNFPEAREALRRLPARSAVIDCEIVKIRPRHRAESPAPPTLYAFDLLHLNGRNVMDEPIELRKERLCTLTMETALLFCPSLHCEPALLLREVKRLSLEGVVAKQKGSPYQPGDRNSWLLMRV